MSTWKTRFSEQLDQQALEFSSSLETDKRLAKEDIEGSLAHVDMLARQKIIPARDASAIRKGLRAILKEVEQGTLVIQAKRGSDGRFVAEDVHMAIEARLTQKIGPVGGKLHTARSRNDQVALDERLYLRSTIMRMGQVLRRLQTAIVDCAESYNDVIMPGYTHLQRGQPVLLAHHLLAYVAMLDRDGERFADCGRRLNQSPLGAGALAGTSFPTDRLSTARALKFDGIIANSIDAVADRDVLIEFLSACAITMMHLSRLAEELVLWSSQEWSFVQIGDAFTTGSSIMPQKKNPDMAELVRGKTGRVYGDLVALLTVMKGLPLAYNRDMQEDKEPLFDAADTTADCLGIMASMMRTVKFRRGRFEKELRGDFLMATELADYLARKGVPFREAHGIVGNVVRECERRRILLTDLSLDVYRSFSPMFDEDLYQHLTPESSIRAKRSAGSTSPREVRRALQLWKKRLA